MAKKPTTTNKEIQKGVTAALPAEVDAMFEADAAEIKETAGQNDLAIPFLSVLQAQSPQCLKQKPEFIKGAEAGMLFNNVTLEIFDGDLETGGLCIIPCYYQRTFVEWIPRDSGGGGFVGDRGLAEGERLLNLPTTKHPDKAAPILENGNELVETHYHFVIYQAADGTWREALFAASSSALTPSRRFNTLVNGMRVQRPDGSSFKPARPYGKYKLNTIPASNDEGDWYKPQFVADGRTIDLEGGLELYKSAMGFARQMSESTLTVVPPTTATEGEGNTAPAGDNY